MCYRDSCGKSSICNVALAPASQGGGDQSGLVTRLACQVLDRRAVQARLPFNLTRCVGAHAELALAACVVGIDTIYLTLATDEQLQAQVNVGSESVLLAQAALQLIHAILPQCRFIGVIVVLAIEHHISREQEVILRRTRSPSMCIARSASSTLVPSFTCRIADSRFL